MVETLQPEGVLVDDVDLHRLDMWFVMCSAENKFHRTDEGSESCGRQEPIDEETR